MGRCRRRLRRRSVRRLDGPGLGFSRRVPAQGRRTRETRTLDELYQAALKEGGKLVGHLVGQVVASGPELTQRESQVVRLMADGHSNRHTAQSLHLSEATVKTHLVRIFRKLGVDDRTAAVSEAVRSGLLELS